MRGLAQDQTANGCGGEGGGMTPQTSLYKFNPCIKLPKLSQNPMAITPYCTLPYCNIVQSAETGKISCFVAIQNVFILFGPRAMRLAENVLYFMGESFHKMVSNNQ